MNVIKVQLNIELIEDSGLKRIIYLTHGADKAKMSSLWNKREKKRLPLFEWQKYSSFPLSPTASQWTIVNGHFTYPFYIKNYKILIYFTSKMLYNSYEVQKA